MTAPGAHILSIGTAVPAHRGGQTQALRFFSGVLRARAPEGDRARLLRYLELASRRSGIKTRHTVLPDYLCSDPSEFEFFPRQWSLEPLPGTARRMKVYEAESPKLARRAAEAALAGTELCARDVTHLVVTTCTGFFAPGLDLALVEALALREDVARTVIGFMGCQAGFNGLRLADQIVRSDPDAVVLQVSVELCTLHLQADPRPEVLAANTLFADGAAAVLYGSGLRPGARARTLGQLSRLASEGRGQMSWKVGDHGFVMFLDKALPHSVAAAAGRAVDELCARVGRPRDQLHRFAVHPGGPRILAAVAHALALPEAALESSYGVLEDYGNMSSASIFFVLARELETRREVGPLLALGFGPGLSVEAALLEVL